MFCPGLSVNPFDRPSKQVLLLTPVGVKTTVALPGSLTQSHPPKEQPDRGLTLILITQCHCSRGKTEAPRGQVNNSRSHSKSVTSPPGIHSNISAERPLSQSLLKPGPPGSVFWTIPQPPPWPAGPRPQLARPPSTLHPDWSS